MADGYDLREGQVVKTTGGILGQVARVEGDHLYVKYTTPAGPQQVKIRPDQVEGVIRHEQA